MGRFNVAQKVSFFHLLYTHSFIRLFFRFMFPLLKLQTNFYNQNKRFTSFQSFLECRRMFRKFGNFFRIIFHREFFCQNFWLKRRTNVEGYVNRANSEHSCALAFSCSMLKAREPGTSRKKRHEASLVPFSLLLFFCSGELDTFSLVHLLSLPSFLQQPNDLNGLVKIFHFNWWNKSAPNLSCEFLFYVLLWN